MIVMTMMCILQVVKQKVIPHFLLMKIKKICHTIILFQFGMARQKKLRVEKGSFLLMVKGI